MDKVFCSHQANNPLGICQKSAVVRINGTPYCRFHALKSVPQIEIMQGTENQLGLKVNLIKSMGLNNG
jgi:hypothetical protein